MDYHGLPTPRTTLATSYVCVLVWCKSCRHQAQADMQKMIDAGMGELDNSAVVGVVEEKAGVRILD